MKARPFQELPTDITSKLALLDDEAKEVEIPEGPTIRETEQQTNTSGRKGDGAKRDRWQQKHFLQTPLNIFIAPSLPLSLPLSFCLAGALQIENSEETDQGKYECVATNSQGVRYSSPANLYVRGRTRGLKRTRTQTHALRQTHKKTLLSSRSCYE